MRICKLLHSLIGLIVFFLLQRILTHSAPWRNRALSIVWFICIVLWLCLIFCVLFIPSVIEVMIQSPAKHSTVLLNFLFPHLLLLHSWGKGSWEGGWWLFLLLAFYKLFSKDMLFSNFIRTYIYGSFLPASHITREGEVTSRLSKAHHL